MFSMAFMACLFGLSGIYEKSEATALVVAVLWRHHYDSLEFIWVYYATDVIGGFSLALYG